MSEELHELLAWHAGLKMGREKIQPEDVVNQPFPASSILPPVVFAFLQRSVQSFLNPISANSGSVSPDHWLLTVVVGFVLSLSLLAFLLSLSLLALCCLCHYWLFCCLCHCWLCVVSVITGFLLSLSLLAFCCLFHYWLCVVSAITGFVLPLSLLSFCCLCHYWLFVVSVITGFVLSVIIGFLWSPSLLAFCCLCHYWLLVVSIIIGLLLPSLLALCCVHIISFLLSPLLLACCSLLAFLFIFGFLLSPSLLASCYHHYWHFVVSVSIGFLHHYCVLTIPEMSASPWLILTSPLPYASATFVVLLLTRNFNCTDSWQVCRVALAKWTLGWYVSFCLSAA